MGYYPQPPPPYAPQPPQPKFVTEDEVAELVEKLVEQKLVEYLRNVLPEVEKKSHEPYEKRLSELERLVKNIDSKLTALESSITIDPSRLAETAIRASVSGAMQGVISTSLAQIEGVIQRAIDVSSQLNKLIQALQTTKVQIDTSSLNAILTTLQGIASDMKSTADQMAALFAKVNQVLTDLSSTVANLSKRLNDLDGSIRIIQNAIRQGNEDMMKALQGITDSLAQINNKLNLIQDKLRDLS